MPSDSVLPKSLPGPSPFQDPGCSYHLVQLHAVAEPSDMANRSPLLDFVVVVVVVADVATQEVVPALMGDFVADARTWGS
jgi:hypothetical protein